VPFSGVFYRRSSVWKCRDWTFLLVRFSLVSIPFSSIFFFYRVRAGCLLQHFECLLRLITCRGRSWLSCLSALRCQVSSDAFNLSQQYNDADRHIQYSEAFSFAVSLGLPVSRYFVRADVGNATLVERYYDVLSATWPSSFFLARFVNFSARLQPSKPQIGDGLYPAICGLFLEGTACRHAVIDTPSLLTNYQIFVVGCPKDSSFRIRKGFPINSKVFIYSESAK